MEMFRKPTTEVLHEGCINASVELDHARFYFLVFLRWSMDSEYNLLYTVKQRI